jgi:hypothetical protein
MSTQNAVSVGSAEPRRSEFPETPFLLIDALERQGAVTTEALALADRLHEEHETWGLSPEWMAGTAAALRSEDWSLLDDLFLREKFLGKNGSFLIVAPYTARRKGETITRLSGIYGNVLPHQEMPALSKAVSDLFGGIDQPVTKILPFTSQAVCGAFGGQRGEAFIVPDGWGFPSSAEGPALNDMSEQSRRFLEGGRLCIERVFEADTAELLLSIYQDDASRIQAQHQEYQFHEAGHASGIGLTRKLTRGLIATWWHGAVEEWRADGVAFEVAARLLSEEEAGRIIASNFCTRFGLDAHRDGGVERDRDVVSSLLLLDQLLRGGDLIIKKQKLALRDASFSGLVQATAYHRLNAVTLTREERALRHEIGLHGCYGSVAVERGSRAVFEGLVREPCAGIYRELQ